MQGPESRASGKDHARFQELGASFARPWASGAPTGGDHGIRLRHCRWRIRRRVRWPRASREDPSKTVCLLEAGGEGRSLLSARRPASSPCCRAGRRSTTGHSRRCRSPGSAAARAISRAAGRWGAPVPSTPCCTRAATAATMTNGRISAATAGHGTRCCPISGTPRATSAARRSARRRRAAASCRAARAARPVTRAFVEACGENQIRRNDDFNGPEQEGAGLYQVTQFWGGRRNGERCSAAAAYLYPAMNRPNLTVITGAR